MGTSGASVRNQLVAAVLARVQGINATGDYVTNLGTNDVRVWRKVPFQYSDLPEVSIMDGDEEVSYGPPLGVWTNELKFEIVAAIGQNLATGGKESIDVMQYMRDALADLLFALGVDRHWTVGGQRLALDTIVTDSQLYADQEEVYAAIGIFKFSLKYRIKPFAPNNVAT